MTIKRRWLATESSVVGIAITMIAFILYGILGFFTGVLGICSIASEEWTNTYDRLLYFIPTIGVFGGILFAFRRVRKVREIEKRKAEEIAYQLEERPSQPPGSTRGNGP